jgi:hypothetical protein
LLQTEASEKVEDMWFLLAFLRKYKARVLGGDDYPIKRIALDVSILDLETATRSAEDIDDAVAHITREEALAMKREMFPRTCSICGAEYVPPDTRCDCGEPLVR